MTNINNQQLWLAGSRFYFQRDAIGGVVQPVIDFGTIDTANPSTEIQKIELKDGDGGTLQTIAEQVTERNEVYELTCYNINPTMMAMLMLSNPPAALTQAATQKTSITHYAHPGHLVQIQDSNYTLSTSKFALGVTSVDAVTGPSGSPTYVEDTDWELVNAERGQIRMINGGSFSSAGVVEITYTPRAISGDRLVVPGTVSEAITGNGFLVWSMNNFGRQVRRLARFSITPGTPQIQIADYSRLVLSARVIADLTADQPAGTLEYWLGDLPNKS